MQYKNTCLSFTCNNILNYILVYLRYCYCGIYGLEYYKTDRECECYAW